ncbi:MAG: hypothetical protein EBQ89_00005, partial [Alphaproteobacteria bacterium]|nr:hypothetical protein [Alphaproteobacteria bacterium]
MTMPTAFERRGDLAQQLFGSTIGDPANLLDLGLMRGIGANVKPFAPTVKEIVERSSKDALNAGKQLSQTTKTINKEMPSQNKEVAYEQDLFTKQLKTPREDNESLFRVAEPSDVSKAKKGTVATPDLQSIHTVQLPTGQFATTTGFSTVQPIRTGFEFAKTPEQVAHITAGLRKSPQEQLVAVVLDKYDRPIQIIRHTIGISNQAAVEPFSLAGSIANTPGAKSFYISHNHPSGLSDLSAADKQISMMLNNLTANTGIENKGIMAVGKGTYSFSSPLGQEIVNQNIPPAIRNKSINMVERVFKRSQVLDKNLISSADDARKMADKIVGDETGLMLLNQRYQPVGFLPVNEKSLLNLRKSGESTNILKALEKANANSAIFVTKKNLSQDQIDNIQKLFNAANVNMLDVLMGETRKSNAMNMSTRGTDFLSIAPPVAGASAIYESMEEPYKKGGKVHISNN